MVTEGDQVLDDTEWLAMSSKYWKASKSARGTVDFAESKTKHNASPQCVRLPVNLFIQLIYYYHISIVNNLSDLAEALGCLFKAGRLYCAFKRKRYIIEQPPSTDTLESRHRPKTLPQAMKFLANCQRPERNVGINVGKTRFHEVSPELFSICCRLIDSTTVAESSCNPLETGQTFKGGRLGYTFLAFFFYLLLAKTEGEVDSYIPSSDRNLRPRYIFDHLDAMLFPIAVLTARRDFRLLFPTANLLRKLLQATIRANRTGHFMWVGSDSWGAKVYPVRDQEFAAEGAITILPYRNALKDMSQIGLLKYILLRRYNTSFTAATNVDFDNYYLRLRPRMGDECGGQTEKNIPHKSLTDKTVNCRNIWFQEFWSQHHKCTFSVNASSDMTRCTGEENLVDYEQEGLVPFVVDAVYAMAHSVHNVIEEECVNNLGTSHYLCESLIPAPDGPRLLQHIRNISFIGELCKAAFLSKCKIVGRNLALIDPQLIDNPRQAKRNFPCTYLLVFAGVRCLVPASNYYDEGRQDTEIKFNSDGDAYGFYNIYQYQRKDEGRFDYILIGTWREELSLDINMTRWATGVGELHIPRSMCSDNCPMGHVRNFVLSNRAFSKPLNKDVKWESEPCCWSCVACREDAYVYNDTCKNCNPGYAPNSTMTGCIKLTAEVIPWTSPWALVPLIFASIGILSTLFTTVVFIRFNRTPVIMASGRELCYVLLVGILSCYGMSFVILSKPTTWNCTYLRIGLGLCLSICYSAILTKTNRISRIFNQGTKKIKRLSYTSPKSQVVIAIGDTQSLILDYVTPIYAGITAVQLIGTIVWLMIEPPDTTEIHPYPLSAVLTCRVSTFSLMMSLVYNMFLILMCTLYAFKTRKIPEDFNEAKYIGFTMYSTCIVWLAFVPIYFGTNNDYKVQIASMCMCINISASVALGCLFTPKVYLVLFQPYKNVRPGHPNTSGMQSGNRAAYSMRFAGGRSQTMQSVTSGSRSSPPMSRGGAGRPDERKHANEHRARTEAEVYVNGNDNGGDDHHSGGGGDDDDDEEERKLSTVQELPELTASPPMSLAMCQARERSQAEPRHDSDQPRDRNEVVISSISERVEARAKKEESCPNEEQILSYSDSPTFSEFSS
ncbi:Metabotropic glutamate receptor 2 [Acromyrmex echinatior]|uniref:Metabotropic glutamate receptor 2 n=1 Tax=Acromyrmex echinatior TaxID=103372 RepID=F4WIC9_ACREC|nr:Metabotropic glutamate receptor 2 [Acromyrmex echinatior]